MFAYLDMMRPLNGLMAVIAVFIGGLLILKGEIFSFFPILLAMVSAFLIAGGGNAINDYVDVDADKVNKPKRPIPSGRITLSYALAFSITLFVIGAAVSFFINTTAFLIAIVNILLLIGYSLWLQHKLLVGNLAVSYLVGSTFLFGGAAAGNILLPGLLLLLAFFANLAREIVKDMEDIEGDRKSFLKRLAGKAKEKLSLAGERFHLSSLEPTVKYKSWLLLLAGLSLILAVLISPLPYVLGILGFPYLVVLIPTDFFFLLALFRLASREGGQQKISSFLFGRRVYSKISKSIKLGMLFGLIAFILGALL